MIVKIFIHILVDFGRQKSLLAKRIIKLMLMILNSGKDLKTALAYYIIINLNRLNMPDDPKKKKKDAKQQSKQPHEKKYEP